MTSSSKKAVESGESGNGGARDSGSVEIQSVVEHVAKCAEAFKAAIRRTVEEAWELGNALVSAKEVIAHGHWGTWLKTIGLNPRLAQRCMLLFKNYPKKRRMSHFKSINAAMRMLPAEAAIDAEFEVEEVEGPNDGSPKESTPPAAGANGASDLSTSRNGIATRGTDETSTTTTERAPGSNSGMPHLPGIEVPSSSAAATASSTGTDPETDGDVDSDIGSLLEEFDGFVTRLHAALGKDPAAVAQQLRLHFPPLSRALRALASTMASCLETAGAEETSGENVPEDLVPTLTRLLKAVPARRRPRSDNSENRT